MARSMFRSTGIVGAFALSGVFLFLAFHEVQWGEIRKALAVANLGLVLLGATVGVGGFMIRAYGWKFLLAPVERLGGWRLFSPVAIGYMTNNLLPARLGEFARAYVVGKRENLSKSGALATIIVERVFDGLTLLLILATISIFFPFASWVKQGGMLVGVAFLVLSLVLLIVAVKVEWILRAIGAVLKPFTPGTAEWMKSKLRNFVVGLDFKNHVPTVMLAFLFTVLRWAFEACIYLSVILSLGLQDRVPIHGALFVMVAVNIACMVPQAPGFLGSVQIASIQALAVFGVDRETAVAYSLLVHAAFFFPITIVGIFCLVRSRFSLSEISRSGKHAGWADSAATPEPSQGKRKFVA